MLAITTCRKPHRLTRALARQLASLLPDSRYIVRGKKSISGLIDDCRLLGLPRLAILEESHGNPAKMEFLEVSGDDWDWDKRVLLLKSAEMPGKSRMKAAGITIAGPDGGKFASLFGVEETPDAELEMSARGGAVTFTYAGSTLLALKAEVVDYDRSAGRDAEGHR